MSTRYQLASGFTLSRRSQTGSHLALAASEAALIRNVDLVLIAGIFFELERHARHFRIFSGNWKASANRVFISRETMIPAFDLLQRSLAEECPYFRTEEFQLSNCPKWAFWSPVSVSCIPIETRLFQQLPVLPS